LGSHAPNVRVAWLLPGLRQRRDSWCRAQPLPRMPGDTFLVSIQGRAGTVVRSLAPTPGRRLARADEANASWPTRGLGSPGSGFRPGLRRCSGRVRTGAMRRIVSDPNCRRERRGSAGPCRVQGCPTSGWLTSPVRHLDKGGRIAQDSTPLASPSQTTFGGSRAG
jgi:hypothetical protein